jgi:hypothetical protein
MIALKISHNGRPVCVAGVGDVGVIMSNVTWVHSFDYQTEDGRKTEHTELSLHIGGLHTPTNEYRTWDSPDIKVGDAVTIEIVESDVVDRYTASCGSGKTGDPEEEREYVRKKAREFGWTVHEEESS